MTLYGSLFITWAAPLILAFPRFCDFPNQVSTCFLVLTYELKLCHLNHYTFIRSQFLGRMSCYNSFSSSKIVLAILGHLFFHMIVRIILLVYMHTCIHIPLQKQACRPALNLEVNFGEIYVCNMESSLPQTWCLSPLF